MYELLKKLSDIIGFTIGAFFIVFLIFILVKKIFSSPIEDDNIKEKLDLFIEENNNSNFFIYNNKKLLLPIIEKEILPNLHKEVNIIFIEGIKIKTEYEVRIISHLLYNLKKYKKFPHLMKIRNGEIIDMSINNCDETNHSIINKPTKELMNQIHSFFEIRT